MKRLIMYDLPPAPDYKPSSMLTGTSSAFGTDYDLPTRVSFLEKSIDQVYQKLNYTNDQVQAIKKIHIKEFKENDVYEVNKRIERLERKIALLQSNQSDKSWGAIAFLIFLIDSLIVVLLSLWWLYA